MSSLDKAAFITLGGMLGYAAFEWGGVLPTDQYEYLLVLGLLAMTLSLGRARPREHPAMKTRLTVALGGGQE